MHQAKVETHLAKAVAIIHQVKVAVVNRGKSEINS